MTDQRPDYPEMMSLRFLPDRTDCDSGRMYEHHPNGKAYKRNRMWPEVLLFLLGVIVGVAIMLPPDLTISELF